MIEKAIKSRNQYVFSVNFGVRGLGDIKLNNFYLF